MRYGCIMCLASAYGTLSCFWLSTAPLSPTRRCDAGARNSARPLLTTRAQLVRMRVDLANQIRGVLKPFGLVAGKGGGHPFMERVRSLVAGGPLQDVAEALLSAWQAISSQVATLSRRLVAIARQDTAV